jgi:hypothetical protein
VVYGTVLSLVLSRLRRDGRGPRYPRHDWVMTT